jgi:hypothetical protein
MLFTLRVREVGALIRVERKAETTFQGAQVVAEDIRVLHEPQNADRSAAHRT